MEGKSVSCYVKLSQREQVLAEFEERGKLSEEKKRLLAYVDGLQNILKRNPYLNAGVGCGYQDLKILHVADSFYNMYEAHRYLLKSTRLEAEDLKEYKSLRELFRAGDTGRIEIAIQRLCRLVYLHYQILPVILGDEYDTPLLEAYTDGYWSEMIGTCRQLFHSTFKENPYYARALITGVTRVSKNSLFSDLNNLETDTVTCEAYSDCFGFTEQEVMDALKCQNMDTMHDVKEMYDGFILENKKICIIRGPSVII